MIRGDLPIVPSASDWFRPSVHPNLDLQEGAMNVMGGFDNENAKSMAALIAASSAGTQTAVGGIDLRSVSNGVQMSLGGGGGDIIASAYP